MKFGLSTASLFCRMNTETALKFISDSGIGCAEVFLSTYYEYTKDFAKVLKKAKGEVDVHSIHTLNTQFEPQLYSINPRASEDAFSMLSSVMRVAKKIDAKYYTFHGVARVKKTPYKMDYDRIGKITQRIIDECKKSGVSLAYENVHWSYYNYIGFFNEVKKRTEGLKGTLDIKQARQSGISVDEYIDEMGSDIVTVHLSDIDENGKMCLPGKGITDFDKLFSHLYDVGFDGALLIEVYTGDYGDAEELIEACDFLDEILYKNGCLNE